MKCPLSMLRDRSTRLVDAGRHLRTLLYYIQYRLKHETGKMGSCLPPATRRKQGVHAEKWSSLLFLFTGNVANFIFLAMRCKTASINVEEDYNYALVAGRCMVATEKVHKKKYNVMCSFYCSCLYIFSPSPKRYNFSFLHGNQRESEIMKMSLPLTPDDSMDCDRKLGWKRACTRAFWKNEWTTRGRPCMELWLLWCCSFFTDHASFCKTRPVHF